VILRSIGATVLEAALNPVSASVTWTSSDPSVATVDSQGSVGGVVVGTATIEALLSYVREDPESSLATY
jgi:uncharacterized protein YjdB